jgi:hypothetical protein
MIAQPPEWIDAKEAKRLFSIGRTTLYSLAEAGKIRTSSLRERGKLRGKRLFSYDSIKQHIEACAVPNALLAPAHPR